MASDTSPLLVRVQQPGEEGLIYKADLTAFPRRYAGMGGSLMVAFSHFLERS